MTGVPGAGGDDAIFVIGLKETKMGQIHERIQKAIDKLGEDSYSVLPTKQ
jgi:hypothetical protein